MAFTLSRFRLRGRSSSSLFLMVSNFGEFALPMLRGIILARMLPPAQFGLAISFMVVSSVAELVTDLGFGQMALRNGTDESIGTLHSLTLLRGALLAMAVFACGPLFAYMFKAPGTSPYYALVALGILLRSCANLEVMVRMRRYDYVPMAATALISHVVWTLVSVGFAFWLRDFRAMVFGIVGYSLAYVAATHGLSRCRWRLRWSRPVVREAVAFGRPLVLNGMAYAAASLGDRFLIGARIGLTPLAQYSALTTAAIIPRNVVSKFLNALFTPQFVNAASHESRQRLNNIWVLTLSGLGSIFGLGFMAFGHMAILIVFGGKYDIPQSVIDAMALLVGVRYLSGLPVAPALATGQTALLWHASALSTAGLALAAVTICWASGLQPMGLAMATGEALAILWIAYRMTRVLTFEQAVIFPAMIKTLTVLSAGVMALAVIDDRHVAARLTICAGLALIELTLSFLVGRLAEVTMMDVFSCIFPRLTEPSNEDHSAEQHPSAAE